MYALASYQHYAVKLDMDHVIQIRRLIRDFGYEECMVKLDSFHDGLLLCMSNKSWVLDLFGKFHDLELV